MLTQPINQTAFAINRPTPENSERLHDIAMDLEATFLSEMLKHAGLGKSRTAFGGGQGEDQFASFLRQEQAAEIARNGGIGLAESIVKSLEGRASDN